jgi:hypothetical protein
MNYCILLDIRNTSHKCSNKRPSYKFSKHLVSYARKCGTAEPILVTAVQHRCQQRLDQLGIRQED